MRDAIIVCGAAALVWNPGFVQAARDRKLTIIAAETKAARYADSAVLTQHPAVWAQPDQAAAVMNGAQATSRGLRIRGVCALREEWVQTAAVLADWLGTPGIGLRAATVCRDKALQRAYLSQYSPRSSLDVASWTRFPAVVKPPHGSAGVGVRPVADRAALGASEGMLIEERVDGPEFSVECLVQGGTVVFAEVTAKRTNEMFVELAHTVPAALAAADRRTLLETNNAVVRRLAVGDGILHTEYRLIAGGRAVLMEVNARCPGGSIPALYHLATGERLEGAILDVAIGNPVRYPAPVRAARQVYLTHKPGVLDDVRVAGAAPVWLAAGDELPLLEPGGPGDPPRLHTVMVIKPRGSELGDLNDNRDRAVTFVIDAASVDELDTYERDLSVEVTG